MTAWFVHHVQMAEIETRSAEKKMSLMSYEIVCKICQKKYVGETARNLKTRANEHDYKTSVMKNHFEENHKDQNPSKETVSIKVTATYKTALDRQISEGVKIKNNDPLTLINQRNEWRHNKNPHLNVTTM